MSTSLLPSEPIDSLDAYLATESGRARVRLAHELGPATVGVRKRPDWTYAAEDEQ